MVLQIGQILTVLGCFLKFLLSNHPKTNTEPYSMTQDSTLDTPQGTFEILSILDFLV